MSACICSEVARRLKKDGLEELAENVRRAHRENTGHVTGGTFPRFEDEADESPADRLGEPTGGNP